MRTEQPCCYVVRRISLLLGSCRYVWWGVVPLGRDGPRARNEGRAPLDGKSRWVHERARAENGPGDGLRTAAWTPSVDGLSKMAVAGS